MNENIIAIDGPAGSGKSSVAREIAQRSTYQYFDSGAYYRAVTLYFMKRHEELGGKGKFYDFLNHYEFLNKLNSIQLSATLQKKSENLIFLGQEDVTIEIRHPEVTGNIKYLAPYREVRDFINANLIELARVNRLIMDGRDIGTEVFPDAKFKFFLTADAKIRARRRWDELKEQGIDTDYEKLLEEIQKRDESDQNRKIAPLKQAEDAFLIDTSNLSKNVVINMILSRI